MSASLPFIFSHFWRQFPIFMEIPPFLPNIVLWYSISHLPICLHHCLSFFSHSELISKNYKIPPFLPDISLLNSINHIHICLHYCFSIFSHAWLIFKKLENYPFSAHYSTLILNKSHLYMSALLLFNFQSCLVNF